ncbi:MAG: leucine--tRNA ligase [Deltaproteobacteria bacterium]|nr:leucine--tRNA ligase [Deltaproteobacteria bacterium]MBW2071830.1 leucine--tRNA ligase [Deltaproteobacteria bacterium]
MEARYDPGVIEPQWQRFWEERGLFNVTEDPDKPKYYLLEMFPYPSGRIHMGHVRNYTIGDVVARYKTMRGYNVLHPMGWDAFGMPAENAAIKANSHPATWTYNNIAQMKAQLKRMGFSYDWNRELATCDVSYYRWEQQIFLKMYERGLAYRKKAYVNWCATCQTVLANEQVEGGLCWRCGQQAEQKEMEQWFLKITEYADELLDYCDKLPGWPERVLTMQRNWIGKSHGAIIHFPIEGSNDHIEVFTTRQDTVYGATFMSLAVEHPLALELCKGKPQEAQVKEFIEHTKRIQRSERTSELLEKEGVFTGSYCKNPMTAARMPIYVANFVLMEYGTGAVMAVPTHDQRDFEFAKKYDLPLKLVVNPPGEQLDEQNMTEAYEEDGVLVNSGQFSGMDSAAARKAIAEYLEANGLGLATVTYRLRDWLISRQRYWGAPIPIIYCDSCGVVPVPEHDLPVVLPLDASLTPAGGTPLPKLQEFVETTCSKCGGRARREVDTMDTFVESSWYFLRYACADYQEGPLDRARVEYWLPVNQYIGGIEHAVLHLLYARFFTKVLRDMGLIDLDEPFTNLLTQGMVCKETLRCPEHGWLGPEDVAEEQPEVYLCRHCGRLAEVGRKEKMSKSKGNVVDPEDLVNRYGADTVRLFCLFASPPEKDLEWSARGVEGCSRFLNRLWRLVYEEHQQLVGIAAVSTSEELAGEARDLHRKAHQCIKKVTEDIEQRFHFNTAVSAVMELVNAIYQFRSQPRTDYQELQVLRFALETAVLLISPMVPHIAESMWQALGHDRSLVTEPWPRWDEEAAAEEKQLIVVQVNGKLRSRIYVSPGTANTEVEAAALADERVRAFIGDRAVRKVVVVPGRLVNVVV